MKRDTDLSNIVIRRKKKLKCRTLIETNIQGESKYRDERGNKYQNVESFQNRTSLPEINFHESLMRKGNIITPREEGRTIKVRIKNKSYQKAKRKRKERENTK